jgi:hypothetical protein
MSHYDLTRRTFIATVTAASLAKADDPWVDLFNGRNLDGWRADKNLGGLWKATGGELVAGGPGPALFYSGSLRSADFRNFELEIEALTSPDCNAGLFFHTAYQLAETPEKGLKIQIGNMALRAADDPGGQKTGSLRGRRNIFKALAADDEWCKINLVVRGKTVQVRVNGSLLVDYTESNPPFIPPGTQPGRFIDHGTFALQCAGARSKVRFRKIQIRVLPDGLPSLGTAPRMDEVYRQILTLNARNYPVVDYHVHLKEGLKIEEALAKSRYDGIEYGIAVNGGKGFPIESDAGAQDFFETMKGQPTFIAMQAEGREWTKMFTPRAVGLFDYVFTDSMTWTDDSGKRMRTWIPEEVGTIVDPETFLETLVARAVKLLEEEPIDIYVNPTYLPDSIAQDYDRLWTEDRMRRVAAAAARNRVAIELNTRYRIPSPAFVRMAKQAGCKFTFGTNNAGPTDLKRSEYGLQMVDACQLRPQDFFVPGAWWPKAMERKAGALRG